MGNLITSLNLLKWHKEWSYHGTGTIRDNWIPKDCPLTNNAAMKKMESGTAIVGLEKEGYILFYKWVDSSDGQYLITFMIWELL